MDACSFATCASSAIVTLSRNRRCTRVLTVTRNQVAAVLNAIPAAEPHTSPARRCTTPCPNSASHTARSEPGRAATCESAKEITIWRRSLRYPSLQSRHIDDNVGGRRSIPPPEPPIAPSGEEFVGIAFLVRFLESLRLQLEHRPIP